MTVLIVDDDQSMLQMLLATVDWDKLEIAEKRTALSAAAAKEVFRAEPVDIMVCDIEMPGESGIELLSWVREQGYQTRNIFLTNHTRFHYAQTAIKLDTVDFIGKMSPPSELEDALRRAVNMVKAMRVQKRYVDYGRYWEENSGLLWRQFWLDLISEKIPPDPQIVSRAAKERLMEWYSATKEGAENLPMLPMLCTVDLAQPAISGWPDRELDYCVFNVLSEVLYGTTNSDHIVSLERGSRAVYAVILDMKDGEGLEKKAREADGLFREYLHFSVNFYIGSPVLVYRLSAEVRRLQAADRENVTQSGGVHLLDPPGGGANIPADKPARMDMAGLRELLAAGDAYRVIGRVKDYFSALPRAKITPQLLQDFQLDFTQLLYGSLSERQIEAHQLFSLPDVQTLYSRAGSSLIDTLKWVSFITQQVTDAIKSSSRAQTITGRVKAYIDEHYAEHVSKAELGAMLYLNPDYLAKLFKKETGQALNDYIAQVRVNAAKAMLADESVPLTDVATRAGFDYYSYFSTTFKKAVGISPSDYRRKVLGHEPEPEGENG